LDRFNCIRQAPKGMGSRSGQKRLLKIKEAKLSQVMGPQGLKMAKINGIFSVQVIVTGLY